MGKLHSKPACKRRENPEGDAFKEVDSSGESDRNKKDLCAREAEEDHLSDHYCSLQVTLPPQRLLETSKSLLSCPENGRRRPQKDTLRRSGRTDEKECNVSVTDENRQEWMITLYDLDNSGKITKENKLSLMQTICELVEASVKQLVLSNGTTLRVKLSVTPLTSRKTYRKDAGISLNERDQTDEAGRSTESQHQQIRVLSSDVQLSAPERKQYSVDENTERRNHYLDLAGVENYTSRFEETSAEEPPQDAPSSRVHHRRPQPETSIPVESSGKSIPFLQSLRSRSKSVGYTAATTKPSKLHGHHPITWCHPSQQQHPLLHSSSKRMHTRARETASPSRNPQDRDSHCGTALHPAGIIPVPQRHEHQHHHEHHHHHHHHHYHPA